MKKKGLFVIFFFLFLFGKAFSQNFLLTKPRLETDGEQLLIYYDIITKNPNDKFYIWVEIEKENGDEIRFKSLSGDVGEEIKAGNNKKINWTPELDSFFLEEEIFVEVKAEKYIKAFNKGSLIFKSMVFPGWGQTNINKGKAWWLTGIAAYGTLAGSYLFHNSYLKSYDSYKMEENPILRNNLLEQTQKQLDYSLALKYSAASIWAVNVLWVVFTPNRYLPLQHVQISLNPSIGTYNDGLLFSLCFDF